MKVVHLNTYSSGGSFEYASLLSNALCKSGLQSQLISRPPTPTRADRQFLNRLVRRISVSLSSETWHSAFRFLPQPDSKDMEGVDLVHLHTVGDWFNVPKWLNSLPARIRVVLSLHDLWHVSGGCFVYQGCQKFSQSCSPCPILRAPANKLLAKRELAWKSKIYASRRAQFVANSCWLAGLANKSEVAEACGGVQVIHPGIDTNVFCAMDKKQSREDMRLPPDKFIIVTGCASLTDPYKGINWMIETLSQLPDLASILVVAVGDGNIQVPEGLAVRFTGAIKDRHILAKLFAAADLSVSASQMETYGLTLVEAMACGTPVVAFRVGGIPEAAPEGIASILCDVNDRGAMLGAISKFRNSPQFCQMLGADGNRLASTRNSPEVFARSFSQIYEDCLARK